MLTWKGVPGDQLTPDQIDAMWRLRAGIFQLRVPEAEDRAKFERRVRMGQRNLLFHDRSGALQAMFSMHWRRSPDGRALWFLPEYGFVGRDHRGDPGYQLGVCSEIMALHARHRLGPMWFAGVGYPRSFQSLERVLPESWTPFDSGRPVEADAVLDYLHHTFFPDAYDPESRLIALPTIPEPRPPGPRGAAWTLYESRNPHWEQGIGMSVAVRVARRLVLRVARDLVQRMLRKSAPRRHARR